VISGAITAPFLRRRGLRRAKPTNSGSKIHGTARFNFKRKATIGAPASGRAIALWDANTKEHFIGSGLVRTMNTNGCSGIYNFIANYKPSQKILAARKLASDER
jgi:hypothetical protein